MNKIKEFRRELMDLLQKYGYHLFIGNHGWSIEVRDNKKEEVLFSSWYGKRLDVECLSKTIKCPACFSKDIREEKGHGVCDKCGNLFSFNKI